MTIAIPFTIPPGALAQNIVQISMADCLKRLDYLMLDAQRKRWDVTERMLWINDAAREIVFRRPAARAITERLALEEGTLQQSSAGTAQVLSIVRNINANGTPGRAISITDRQQLDDADPDWHQATADRTLHFMVDERSPTTFHVYPPAIEGAIVETLVSKAPPEVTDPAGSIDLRAEFINAIINWALYRCHTKDSEHSNGAVAAQHYQAFTDAIGAPAQAALTNSANGNNT